MNVLHYPEEVFAEIELQDQSMQFESMQLMKHRFDETFPEFSLAIIEPRSSSFLKPKFSSK